MKHVKLVLCLAGNLNYLRIRYYFIVFPLISAPGAYLILNLLGAAFIRGQRLFHGKGINHLKILKICHCLFQNENETQNLTLNKPKKKKKEKSKYLNINNIFIVALIYACYI